MVRLNDTLPVPEKADKRLAELATLLARGVCRLEAQKSRFRGRNRLAMSAKTSLNVTPKAAEAAAEQEVT